MTMPALPPHVYSRRSMRSRYLRRRGGSLIYGSVIRSAYLSTAVIDGPRRRFRRADLVCWRVWRHCSQ